ncbi:MAG: EEP domain-containing protein [Gammaproteobacteria bacterium]|nr:EEP domain-containing protein [Gammaproteobacteria bacterium]
MTVSRQLRLLSYNIQAGVGTQRYHEYVTHGWKHLLPHRQQRDNLGNIGDLVRCFDLVGLQEVDGGSLRSGFMDQTEYLAQLSSFPHWYTQTNRRLGKIAHHSLGVLSRIPFAHIEEVRLPGAIPGRGALMLRLGGEANPLIVTVVHLALGRRARRLQIAHLGRLLRDYRYVVLMGDLNCGANSPEFRDLLDATRLCRLPLADNTFPSWRPVRGIDHVLASPGLRVVGAEVLSMKASDHLPIAVELEIPAEIALGDATSADAVVAATHSRARMLA